MERSKRKTKPFLAVEPKQVDERLPPSVWGIPKRIEHANRAGGFNYNQSEMAEATGLSQSVLSKIAAYQNLYGIRLDTLYKIADALNVTVPAILGEAGGKQADTRQLAKEAADMLTELDGVPAVDAWDLMKDVEVSSDNADSYYVAAKRLLASRVGLSAEDLAAHEVKARKVTDGSVPLRRRSAR